MKEVKHFTTTTNVVVVFDYLAMDVVPLCGSDGRPHVVHCHLGLVKLPLEHKYRRCAGNSTLVHLSQ